VYVTLPSNASLHVYLNNKMWRYRTKLAKPIVVSEPYEVGVIELQYPRVWSTFPASDVDVLIYDSKTNQTATITMFAGFYDSIPRILKEFNAKCIANPITSRLGLQYNNITNHVYFSGGEGYKVTFRGKLAEILGFKPGEPFEIPATTIFKKIYASPHPADIFGGVYNIYVYSNIVDYQLVGDSHVPLLRCINITPEVGRMPTLTYDKPHYTSLSKSVIDDIKNKKRYI
ncbi:hypothetical protein P7M41_26250, partial [Vibrio parahaemolyticus]|nr:hypothetical protein [Vibrio parahaemolyticus]